MISNKNSELIFLNCVLRKLYTHLMPYPLLVRCYGVARRLRCVAVYDYFILFSKEYSFSQRVHVYILLLRNRRNTFDLIFDLTWWRHNLLTLFVHRVKFSVRAIFELRHLQLCDLRGWQPILPCGIVFSTDGLGHIVKYRKILITTLHPVRLEADSNLFEKKTRQMMKYYTTLLCCNIIVDKW